MEKNFITVTPDSGNNDGSLSVTVGNNTGDARSEVITVTDGEISKTLNVNQKGSNLGHLEIAGGIYSNGNLISVQNFGLITDITAVANNPSLGRFVFPTPIQEMARLGGSFTNTFLRLQVKGKISSDFNQEKVVAFLESASGNTIYTPKKDLTVYVYNRLDSNIFDLDIADRISVNNAEIFNINSALNGRQNIAILLTNNKRIQFINLIWKAAEYL